MNQIEFFRKWEMAFKNANTKPRKCLIDGCKNEAIKSHALQKNGILKQISEKNHLYQFSNVSPFQKQTKGSFELLKIGINDAYTFQGFCNKHDSSIFKPIEIKDFDISDDSSISLFSYRALCQEIRRKESAIDFTNAMILTKYNPSIVEFFTDYKSGLENGLKNLNYFKTELESNKSNFTHKICEIPKIEICLSAPLNIYDKNNFLTETHNDFGEVLNNPFVTSFLNIFPFNNKSYVMISIHNNFKCNWTIELFDKFQNIKSTEHLKLISDLITTRIEFWCISPKLKQNISTEKINELIQIWSKEVLNFDYVIETKLNLFE